MRCTNCGHKVKRYHGKSYHCHGYLVHNLTLKCSNCDCRTPDIQAEDIAIKPSMDRFLIKMFNKIKYELNKKPYYNRFSSNRFFNNLFWMIILSLTFAVIYYNIDNINLPLKGFPLGHFLILINGFFWIKYSYQMLKGVVYWYGDQRNWIKCLVFLIILSLAWQAYQQKETISNSLIDLPNQNLNNPKNTELKLPFEKALVGWWNENQPKAGFNPETSDIENIVSRKVNEERNYRGLRALTWDSDLAEVARLHSLDMANRSYFSHDNPEGDDPTMRARKHGVQTESQKGSVIMIGIAENIGMMPTGNVIGYGYVSSSNDIADAMMKSWMNSPGHRANILDASYDFIGVGVAYNGYGTYYLTQDFK